MVTLIENDITVEEYLYLRKKVGWAELGYDQAGMALNNSIIIVKALDRAGKLVGMGRMVGDGAVICYIQDLIVIPCAQGKGIGSMIIKRLKEYALSIKQENTTMMLCLMCAKGREAFYEKHDFIPRPNDKLGPGMIQYLK